LWSIYEYFEFDINVNIDKYKHIDNQHINQFIDIDNNEYEYNDNIMMTLKEFKRKWKDYGLKVACDNWLITFTKKFIGAKRISITYLKGERA